MREMLLRWYECVFPERPDHRIVRNAIPEDLIRLLKPTRDDTYTYLLPFSEPLVKACIHEAKFHRNEKAWYLLSTVLAAYLKHTDDVILVPIPLSRARKRTRGYNQSCEIASRAAKGHSGVHMRTDILYRIRDTKPQTSLSRTERLTNMTEAFIVVNHELFPLTQKHVIIFDDVVTTGATLQAAADALRPFTTNTITLLALAH